MTEMVSWPWTMRSSENGAGFGGREDADVEAGGVVVLEIGFDLGDDLGVVGAVFVEPEDGGRRRRRGRV